MNKWRIIFWPETWIPVWLLVLAARCHGQSFSITVNEGVYGGCSGQEWNFSYSCPPGYGWAVSPPPGGCGNANTTGTNSGSTTATGTGQISTGSGAGGQTPPNVIWYPPGPGSPDPGAGTSPFTNFSTGGLGQYFTTSNAPTGAIITIPPGGVPQWYEVVAVGPVGANGEAPAETYPPVYANGSSSVTVPVDYLPPGWTYQLQASGNSTPPTDLTLWTTPEASAFTVSNGPPVYTYGNPASGAGGTSLPTVPVVVTPAQTNVISVGGILTTNVVAGGTNVTVLAAGTTQLSGAGSSSAGGSSGGDATLDMWATNNAGGSISGVNVITNFGSVPYSFTAPTIGSASPSITVPFSTFNDGLAYYGVSMSDQTLDWTTSSLWSTIVPYFRAFCLFLVTLSFVFLCLRTLRTIAPK